MVFIKNVHIFIFCGVPFKAWLKILIKSKCLWLLMARLNSCSIAVFETPDNQKVSCWNSSPLIAKKYFVCVIYYKKKKGSFANGTEASKVSHRAGAVCQIVNLDARDNLEAGKEPIQCVG